MATYVIAYTGQFTSTYSYPFSGSVNIADSEQPFKRVITAVSASETNVLNVESFDQCFVQIRNLGDFPVRVRLFHDSGETIDMELPVDRMISIPSKAISGSRTGQAFSAFDDYEDIIVQGIGGDSDVEVLVIPSEVAS